MASKPSQSLTPHLWSKLPREILINIVYQTTDQSTLTKWCEATQGTHLIYESAMKARWQTVTIDDRDLLPASGHDRREFNQIQRKLKRHELGQHWKPVGEMVYTLLNTNDKSGRCPAHYVQKLIFDFRMLKYWKEFEHAEFSVHDVMPSMKALEHTLDMLKDQLSNVRQVVCHGDTPRAMLKFITSTTASIHQLELRSREGYGRIRMPYKDEPSMVGNPTMRWPLQWELFITLRQLRSLKIHRLTKLEIPELVDVMPRLVSLYSLVLACEYREHSYVAGGCPLEALFDQILRAPTDPETQHSERLPPNLLSLKLIDTYSSYQQVKLPSTQSLILRNTLVNLTMDITNVDWVPVIIGCLPESKLRVLSIPVCSQYDPGYSDHFYLNEAIAKHQSSLDKVQVFRAWDTDSCWVDQLSEHWKSTYAFQELVLGTRTPEWYHGSVSLWREKVPQPTLLTYLCGFRWDNQPDCGRWGAELRRIRIDHIDVVGLNASVLSESFYSHVKILMLQPVTHLFQDQFEERVADRSTCTDLAEHILIYAQPSLRVIVIGPYKYWVNRQSSSSDRELWPWADAMDNAVQTQLITSILTQTDLDFLKCTTVPQWFERDFIQWHQNRPHQPIPYTPSEEMLHQWNYLTLLPLSDIC